MIVGIVIGIVIICVGICVEIGVFNKFKSKTTVYTEGDIVDYKEDYFDGRIQYYPIVEYVVDGKKYRHVSSYGSYHKQVRSTMNIKYKIYDPSESYDGNDTVGKGIICFGLIILFFVGMYNMKK